MALTKMCSSWSFSGSGLSMHCVSQYQKRVVSVVLPRACIVRRKKCNSTWMLNKTWTFLSSSIQVRLGEHNINANDGSEQYISSSKVIKHPSFSSSTLNNDIMLIKLSKAATLNSKVATVALPTSCASAGTQCLVSGWGNTLSSGSKCLLE